MWISVEERLPESGVMVLTYNARASELRNCFIVKWAAYNPESLNDGGWWSNNGAAATPTHWQPLPEPPEEG